MKIAFIISRKRNNVVFSFGTLKVQSFMLTEVRDCDLLIVVTSSTFLKRKDILKEKRPPRSPSLRRVSIQTPSSQISQVSRRQNDVILPDTNL